MKKTLAPLFIAAAATIGLSAPQADAAVIMADFDDLSQATSTIVSLGTNSYTEDNITFTTPSPEVLTVAGASHPSFVSSPSLSATEDSLGDTNITISLTDSENFDIQHLSLNDAGSIRFTLSGFDDGNQLYRIAFTSNSTPATSSNYDFSTASQYWGTDQIVISSADSFSIDNVTLDAPSIPEPSSIALALAATPLLLRRRRKDGLSPS